ncbi:SAM-dependent methyltransferase [Roseicitreum antarcticum]|uniref:Methyltransferase domain-containing protein n=1 Tax=Roseicitreum antarcticum TaxID=564137 RepID=A0A1H3AK42_9RHOB|nr:SAM-dependent methyltransferase [Roseicitreum antarcticum]SDX30082.1 hypothetical protein SAMN04488238_10732 [Roseicitreum antarcticum]
MTRPPALTDRSALNRNRQRALQNGDFFAHTHIAAEFQERLNEVNRTFTRPAIVTGFPHLWADFLPNATLVPDGEILDLQPGAHDLIIDALTLHWADDPVGQLVQARRALLPDGMYLAALPGGQTLSELRSALAEAEVALTGGLSPRVLPMAEIRDLGALLQRAGFALPVADSVLQTASYRDLRHLAADLRAMGEGNALMQRLRRPAPRGLIDQAETLYRANYPAPDNRILASFDCIYLTGWAPSADQPQPLRPGTARARLADALQTQETPLGDAATPLPAARGHESGPTD